MENKNLTIEQIEEMTKTECLVRLLKEGESKDQVDEWDKKQGTMFAQLMLAKKVIK